ncbi:MAG TPA: M48 family metallopeptidase [Candidatus Dormibacteraeota bacterium]|nr:M48 family metallopeptidase [Candidatus Dormibacteraeota bacterium]
MATPALSADDAVDESVLRNPLERPILFASIAGNFVLMGLAIALVFYQPGWLKSHAFLSKEIGFLRILAITALIGIPLLVLNRNRRESSIRGNSVRLSDKQFPEVYAILRDHCRRLGMVEVPELFLTASTIAPFSQTFSSWREKYIVIHQSIFDIDDSKTMDVVSFVLAHELGAIRLNQTAVWNEMLLTYVSAIKWLRNPLERVRTYSRDRYGAALSPTGFRGLLIHAVGRRLMDHVDIVDYLAQERRYGGFWSSVNVFFEGKPQVFTRLRKLHDAGYRYEPLMRAPKCERSHSR